MMPRLFLDISVAAEQAGTTSAGDGREGHQAQSTGFQVLHFEAGLTDPRIMLSLWPVLPGV